MNGVHAIKKLRNLGYRFQVQGETLLYEWQGSGKPDPSQVRPLLALVKEHKPDVLKYLRKSSPPERVLTCFECGHFRPGVNSPNPTQAWGQCRKRNKGRYAAATACQAIISEDR